jgi:inosine-uridine nucleoside N-ribohydrolase
MQHVIIDTDPGIDDALALILALGSPELIVEAFTTVSGNVSLEKTCRNTMQILEYMGENTIPVAAGAAKPLIRIANEASGFHGKTGLGEAVLPEPKLDLDDRSAIQVIVESAEKFRKDLTLVAIGPLTNIATAILGKPNIVDEISELVIMGGAFNLTPFGTGNVNAVAEFNIWHDPEAAKIVFDSGIPITAVGLDVTTDPANRLTADRYSEIQKLGSRNARLVTDLCGRSIRRYSRFSLHDPLAVAAVVDRGIVETERHRVDVEIKGELTLGMTVVDRRTHRRDEAPANVDICVSVDSERFLEMFMERTVR